MSVKALIAPSTLTYTVEACRCIVQNQTNQYCTQEAMSSKMVSFLQHRDTELGANRHPRKRFLPAAPRRCCAKKPTAAVCVCVPGGEHLPPLRTHFPPHVALPRSFRGSDVVLRGEQTNDEGADVTNIGSPSGGFGLPLCGVTVIGRPEDIPCVVPPPPPQARFLKIGVIRNQEGAHAKRHRRLQTASREVFPNFSHVTPFPALCYAT